MILKRAEKIKCSEEHLKKSAGLRWQANIYLEELFLDDNDKMIGSMIVYEFPDGNLLMKD